MFKKLLIANRGEIACRIIKTAKRLGIHTIAIYSDADAQNLHVKLADEAWRVGPSLAAESYLNIEKIIEICIATAADAVHPGYGFLSENVAFAEALKAANITFVGPNIEALRIMGSKQLSKQLLEKSDVPLTPGYHGADQNNARLLSEAKQIGFPVLLKAALGGGGKGMRAVYEEAHFSEALQAARRESLAYFADDALLIEKLIENPRHIEIQLMADHFDQVVHIFERDCSIQRRHQKIIEEAPAPNLSETLRNAISQAAIMVAKKIKYLGAGTVEFLVNEETQDFYFMEMNTRLQVEHPVTEMISGLDLVEWQLRIAANEPLPLKQAEIQAMGHAIECRIYAEDPAQGFIPSVGEIQTLQLPQLEGVRIDIGVQAKDSISRFYDPMFAKLIAWGEDRAHSIQRMQQALAQFKVSGIKTNIEFLQAILNHAHFEQAELNTHFLIKHTIESPPHHYQHALFAAASYEYFTFIPKDPLLHHTFSWQMHLHGGWHRRYQIDGEIYPLYITPYSPNKLNIQYKDYQTTFKIYLESEGSSIQLFLYNEVQCLKFLIDITHESIIVHTAHGSIQIKPVTYQQSECQSSLSNSLSAPMSATIIAILKEKGDKVTAGESLIILEAMKMEHIIYAPSTGQITEIFFSVGSQVNEGVQLAAIEPVLHE